MTLAKKSANVCKAALMMVLLSVSVCASAQEQNATPASEVDWQVGDTVVIKRESLRYLTGERMSNWVYFVSHPILQIGTKRFPAGVLLNGIMSWVGPNDIMLKGAVAREDSVAQAVAEQKKAEQKKENEKRAE